MAYIFRILDDKFRIHQINKDKTGQKVSIFGLSRQSLQFILLSNLKMKGIISDENSIFF